MAESLGRCTKVYTGVFIYCVTSLLILAVEFSYHCATIFDLIHAAMTSDTPDLSTSKHMHPSSLEYDDISTIRSSIHETDVKYKMFDSFLNKLKQKHPSITNNEASPKYLVFLEQARKQYNAQFKRENSAYLIKSLKDVPTLKPTFDAIQHLTKYPVYPASNSSYPASCLNKVYDEIFVISSANRHQKLAVTLFQLQNENISFTVWNCHSSNNPISVRLFKEFKHRVRTVRKQKSKRLLKLFAINQLKGEHIFYLRQTQVDIFKYALSHNLSKILILEDDIIMANPEWFQEFCVTEPFLPDYSILNIGVNQANARQFAETPGFIHRIRHVQNSTFKYSHQNYHSYGVFGTAFTSKIFQYVIDLFDGTDSILPLDGVWMITNAELRRTFLNLYPTLIIPDVTEESELGHESGWQEEAYLRDRTVTNDKTLFSKYWNYRFNSGSPDQIKLTQLLQQRVSNLIDTNQYFKITDNK